MKIKVEIVTDELNTISTKYIDVENYQHTKDFHVESVLEEMADEMLLDIKWKETENLNSELSKGTSLSISDVSESNSTDLETIENKIIECLNEADNKLDADDFSRLAESIIDYIDEIGRSKR